MPYIVVENFKGGLDTRRHKLSSAPGTLTSLVNAHVTRGGEIEKRKAFNLTYTLPVGTFGLETSSGSVYVFGSLDLVNQMPAGVIYQRLVSPDGAGVAMTDVVYSTVYGGKPFVIAMYENGKKYPFWDGSFIKDFSGGIVTAAMLNNTGIVAHLASLFSYMNNDSQPYSVQAIGNKLRVIGPPGVEFKGSIIKNSLPAKDGVVIQKNTGPTPDNKSKGSFSIASGSVSASASIRFSLRQHLYENLPPVTGLFIGDSLVDIKEAFGFACPLSGTISCSVVQGSAVITPSPAAADFITKYVVVGMGVAGQGIPDGSTIASINGTVSFSISINVTGTFTSTPVTVQTKRAVITGFGAWDMPSGVGGDPGQRFSASFSHYVNANTINSNYSATFEHWGGGWNNRDPGHWTLIAPVTDYETANGKDVWVEFNGLATYPGSTGGNPGDHFFDYAQVLPSPYFRPGEDPQVPNGRSIMKTATGQLGQLANGTFNGLLSIKADGVEILGARVAWTTSNSSLALNAVNQINSYLSATEYTASVSNNTTITVEALTGTGASANGKTLSATPAGDVTLSAFVTFSGGTNLILASPQIMEFELLDTFTPGDKYSIIIVDPSSPSQPYQFGFNRVGGVQPNFSATYKGKEYVAAGSTLYFSKLNDATKWGTYELGSGFIDMSNNFGGREDLTGFGAYQGYVAIFTRRNCQLWFFDPDPASNAQKQILDNTGCLAPGSVASVGAVDMFYLADNGIRSLRARESTDAAYANDIGSPVDQLVIDHMRTLTEIDKYNAKSIIEPEDGRYWLSFGSKLFVLSSFSGSGINAWSEYQPGFQVQELASMENKVYARSAGNQIFVYGGLTGNVYDSCPVTVEMPYLDANKPASFKSVNGLDVTVEGKWTVYMGFDYTNADAKDEIATMQQPTFALGRIPVSGYGTHVGLKLTNSDAGYAKLANVIVHYDDQHSKHEAG